MLQCNNLFVFRCSPSILLYGMMITDLKSLGFTSMLGTSGLLYTAVMMAIRFFDGSYATGGKFHGLLPQGGTPAFGVKSANPLCFLVSFVRETCPEGSTVRCSGGIF